MKKNLQEIAPFFLQNILYKTLFATNFVGNTCEFYNFVGNNYPQRNYLPIKILRKNSRKMSFLAIFFNKFARKFPCNMRIFSSVLNQPILTSIITNTISHNSHTMIQIGFTRTSENTYFVKLIVRATSIDGNIDWLIDKAFCNAFSMLARTCSIFQYSVCEFL